MGKGQRKYISLLELHNDEVEKALIAKDTHWGYLDVLCCSEDDYLYYEDCAESYFMDKNIHLVDEYNDEHQLTVGGLPAAPFKFYNEIFYEIDFNAINSKSQHPMIIQFMEHFKILEVVKNFKIYFMFHQRAWSNAEVPAFDIVLSSSINNRLYHKPSVFSLKKLFDTNNKEYKSPEYADTFFKRVVYNDIERRPRVYEGFHDIEDLINNFEAYSWMVDAITY
jgi:hypothetical protein